MKKCVAVIPARGGSKRIPRKNLALLDGEPLIAYTLRAAQEIRYPCHIVVSTDDAEIADVARGFERVDVRMRPAEFATDEASSLAVIRHAVQTLEQEGEMNETILLLQPTSPLRTGAQINEALNHFFRTKADTLTSVVRVHEHPYWLWQPDGERIVPLYSRAHVEMGRGELPLYFIENGAIYIMKRPVLDTTGMYGEVIVPFEMDFISSTDIDDAQDLAWAEFLMNRELFHQTTEFGSH